MMVMMVRMGRVVIADPSPIPMAKVPPHPYDGGRTLLGRMFS